MDAARRSVIPILGVLLPLFLSVRHAVQMPPTFDGAMNLQVAVNLAEGEGYVRQYGEERAFPTEVETAGPFLALAVAAIWLFGVSPIALQLPNLVFVLLLLATVSWLVRANVVAQLIVPGLLLSLLPGAFIAFGGYGELPVAATVLLGFLLLALVAQGTSRPYLVTALAFLLLGLAFTIKVVAVAALPVALLGVVLARAARPHLQTWRLLAASTAAAFPVVIVELVRLITFGGISGYIADSKEQVRAIAYQSGADQLQLSVLGEGRRHLQLLTEQTSLSAPILVLLLLAPLVVLPAVVFANRRSLRRWLGAPGRSFAVMLTAYAGMYIVWWLFVTPVEKAWLRRLLPGLVVLAVLYIVLLGMALASSQRRSLHDGYRSVEFAVAAASVAVLVGVSAAAAPTTWDLNWRNLVTHEGYGQDGEPFVMAVRETRALHAQGRVLFGAAWLSAPALSLASGVEFGNLTEVDACGPVQQALFAARRAVLVWDRSAQASFGSPDPALPYGLGPLQNRFPDVRYAFREISRPSEDAAFYEVWPLPGVCPRQAVAE